MRRLIAFEVVTADGFREGPEGEFDWPNVDPDFERLSIEQGLAADALLFGRVTYQYMSSYWPTPHACEENDPKVVALMNDTPKFVFSRSGIDTPWSNSELVRGEATEAVEGLKAEPGNDLAVLGSFTLVISLLEAGLMDELRVMVNPVLLGRGKPMFEGLTSRVPLELVRTTAFASGNVLLRYRPAAR